MIEPLRPISRHEPLPAVEPVSPRAQSRLLTPEERERARQEREQARERRSKRERSANLDTRPASPPAAQDRPERADHRV